jgi:hypothetical protein
VVVHKGFCPYKIAEACLCNGKARGGCDNILHLLPHRRIFRGRAKAVCPFRKAQRYLAGGTWLSGECPRGEVGGFNCKGGDGILGAKRFADFDE